MKKTFLWVLLALMFLSKMPIAHASENTKSKSPSQNIASYTEESSGGEEGYEEEELSEE